MRSLLILITATTALTAGWLPLEDPLALWLRHMEVTGDVMYPAILPASVEITSRGAFTGISEELARRSGRPSSPFLGDVRLGGEAALQGEYIDGDPEHAEGLKFRLGGHITERLTFDHQLSLWAGSRELPPGGFSPYHINPEPVPGRHLYPDWGYLDYRTDRVSLRLGRYSQQWGPGRFTQLLVSDNSPPLDLVSCTFSFTDDVHFTSFTSPVESDTGSWFSAHRLDLHLRKNLRLGLYEGAFYTGNNIDLAYTNPILFWYAVQWNEQDDDNLFMGVDVTWKPHSSLAAYAEWLIDDFQYMKEYDRPNKMGATVGLDWVHAPTGLAAVVEYTAIQKYVYSQKLPRNYFLHNDRIIGSELGPDSDRITISAGFAGLWPLLAEVRGSITRHGEGTVYDGFPDSVSTGEPWPSGIVERTADIELNLRYGISDALTAFGSVGYSDTDNAGHMHDSTAAESRVVLRLVYGI